MCERVTRTCEGAAKHIGCVQTARKGMAENVRQEEESDQMPVCCAQSNTGPDLCGLTGSDSAQLQDSRFLAAS